MEDLPQAAFVIDPNREQIAVQELRKLRIPIVAVVDTNCDPDVIDFLIPGNDDAIRAIKLFASGMAEACNEGLARMEDQEVPPAAAKVAEPETQAEEQEAAAEK
jgi:small subunit ribosomal protein S2